MHEENTEVIVVGAGPVGMMVAMLLGQQGIQTVVVERNEGVCHHPRAQTIDDESLRSLASVAIGDDFVATTLAANGSSYYDASGNCFAEVGPGSENYGYPRRNYMLQQHLERQMLDRLLQLDSVSVHFNELAESVTQDNDAVYVKTASDRTITASFLLACDGGQSPIRTSLGIEMQGQTYEQDWIVLDVSDDPDTERVSRFYCDPARPAVSIASPGGGRRYEFMLNEGERSEQVLEDACLARILAPYRSFDPNVIERRAVYTFHARIAQRLREQRVLLLGDAAHLSPPFAGQGMNAGIRDAHNVGWKLALHLRHGVGADILDSYESERRKPVWSMIQLAVAMGEFVMPMGEQQLALTRSVMMALERFPEASDWLFQMKFKPKPRYDAGLFVDLNNPEFEASLVGEMIPQPAAVTGAADSPQGLDWLLGAGFALIAQDDAGEQALSVSTHELWHMLEPSRLRLHRSREQLVAAAVNDNPTITKAAFHGDDYYRPLLTHRDQLMLVRPDRYVAGCCYPDQLDGFADRFLKMLTQP